MRPDNVAIVVACALVCSWAGADRSVWAAAKTRNRTSASDTEGLKHAHKANHLADINKCKLAIPEYTTALRLMKGKDPTLLFNRAECYRRIGDSSKAVADYRKFLIELPAAPNRGQVESQIAVLTKPANAPFSGPPSLPSVPSSVPPSVAAAPAPAESPPAHPGRPETREEWQAAERRANEGMPGEDDGPSPALAKGVTAPAPAPAPAPSLVETDAPMSLVDMKARAEPAGDTEHASSRWWIWVVGAVVVAGGAVGAYVALNQGKTDVPASALGNYKF